MRNLIIMTKLIPILSTVLTLLTLLSGTAAQTPSPESSPTPLSPAAAIEAYCKEVDDFVKSHPREARFFGDVAPYDQSGVQVVAPTSKWREFRSRKARRDAATKDNLYNVADVWLRDGKVVFAYFEWGSPSGDWSQFVTYYFRDDGTLAKSRNMFSHFAFNATIIKDKLYDPRGKQIRSLLRCFEMGNLRKRKKCEGDYSNYDADVYRRVQNLPFYAAFKTQRAKKISSNSKPRAKNQIVKVIHE